MDNYLKLSHPLTTEQFDLLLINSINECELVKGSLVIVGVSGGPDSLALLHSLHRTRSDTGIEIHVGHLNHELRGKESQSDLTYVSQICKKLNVGFTSQNGQVYKFKENNHLSLEDASRIVRYKFFSKLAKKLCTHLVAVGHTRDDQVETILMNIVRGTGLNGLKGMSPCDSNKIGDPNTLIIRPILQASREDTVEYCKKLGLEPRHDPSNYSLTFTRNQIRHNIIPALSKINPRVNDSVIRLSTSAKTNLEFIKDAVNQQWETIAYVGNNYVSLDSKAIHQLSHVIKTHLIRKAIQTITGNTKNINLNHIDIILELLNGRVGTSIDLPNSIKVSVGYSKILITYKNTYLNPFLPIDGEFELDLEGKTKIPGWHIQSTTMNLKKVHLQEKNVHLDFNSLENINFTSYLSLNSSVGGFKVRNRKAGDKFQPTGMTGTKKLKDFMIDNKIDKHLRNNIPLVIGNQGIAWVVGWRLSEWAKPLTNDKSVIKLEFGLR